MLNTNQIEQFESHIKELRGLGYGSFDISRIIKDEIGAMEVPMLNNEQYEDLISVLKGYIQFARKCGSSFKPK